MTGRSLGLRHQIAAALVAEIRRQGREHGEVAMSAGVDARTLRRMLAGESMMLERVDDVVAALGIELRVCPMVVVPVHAKNKGVSDGNH